MGPQTTPAPQIPDPRDHPAAPRGIRFPIRISGLVLVALAAASGGQEVILDNLGPEFQILAGNWTSSTYAPGYIGSNYLFCTTTSAGGVAGEVEWRPNLPSAGVYSVCAHYTAGSNRADNAPFTVHHRDGSEVVAVNQQMNGRTWVSLGSHPFEAGTTGCVRLGNNANPSVVIADAVRFRKMSFGPDDARIDFEGDLFPRHAAGAMLLQRFTDAVLADPGGTFSADIARTASGIAVRFRTDSMQVTASFAAVPGYQVDGEFVIFQSGVETGTTASEDVAFTSPQPGQAVTYRILCPPYQSLSFLGLSLDANASLYRLPPECRPRYAAFGDSITHGGQALPRSDQNYPWLLAQAKGWEAFNLGVGGSKVTPSFGSMLDGESLDVATVLWGQNHMSSNNLPLFISEYEQFLTNLRQTHPTLAIYCITLTAAGSENATREQYRQAVRDIVAARQAAGDTHIDVIEGLSISTSADLRDSVHFSAEGAANVAGRLADIIHYPGGSGVFLDFDRDCDIDGRDLEVFLACSSGPAIPLPAGCEDKDLDRDGDVDQSDFGTFQRCFTASGGPIDPACAGRGTGTFLP